MAHVPPARARRLAQRAQHDPERFLGGFDESATGVAADGVLRCAGWAWPFGDERVRRVDIRVDGAPAGSAVPTLRPDIAEAFDLPAAAVSGFEAAVEAPAGRDEVRLTATVHGLDGGTWSTAELAVARDPERAPIAGPYDEAADAAAAESSPAAPPIGEQREFARRRLGYDPWHRVVLLEGRAGLRGCGAAIAALDAIAERVPDLELLIAGVPPESALADLLRRTIAATGLEDRVTVPRGDEPAGYWRAIADLPFDPATAPDLAAAIASLAAAGGAEGAV